MLTNVFIIILAICKSSFEKFYSGHFSTFKSANFFSVPYKFTKLIFCQTNTSQMFSPILWVVSLLFIVSFAFSFDLSQLINLYICFLWFWDLVQKNLCPQQCSVSSYLFFFLFHILGLTFNSLITFKLIFCKVKERSSFMILHLDVQVSQYHWLKRISFLQHMILLYLSKIKLGVNKLTYSWVFYSVPSVYMSVFMPVPCYFGYVAVCLKSGTDSSFVPFTLDCFDLPGFYGTTHILVFFSISVKNVISMLMGITLICRSFWIAWTF